MLVLLALLVVLLAVAPYFACNYLNNHGEELLGRKVYLNSLSINYFKASVSLDQLLVYEEDGLDTFLYVNRIHANAALWSCLNENYVVEELVVEGLHNQVILTKDGFNFDSIVAHFSSEEEAPPADTAAAPIVYAVQKLSLSGLNVDFFDRKLNSHIGIRNLKATLPGGMASDKPEVQLLLGLDFLSGGHFETDFKLNLTDKSYQTALKLEHFNLAFLMPYLTDFLKVENLQGALQLDLSALGKLNDETNTLIRGSLALDGLRLDDEEHQRLVGLKHLEIGIDSLNPKDEFYAIHKFALQEPFAHFELYPETDNFSKLMKEEADSSTDTTIGNTSSDHSSNLFSIIGHYVQESLQDLNVSNYRVDTILVSGLKLEYQDFTLLEPFRYTVSGAGLFAHHVRSDVDSLPVKASARLNNKGLLTIDAHLNPQQPQDMNLVVAMNQLDMRDLSPYFYENVAYSVESGACALNSSIQIKNQILNSDSKLELVEFDLEKQQMHKGAEKLPMKLAVSVLKDHKGDIELDVPVEGNLADPDYKVGKAIRSLFKDLLVKTAVSPYKLLTRGLNIEPDLIKQESLRSAQDSLRAKDRKKLEHVRKVLKSKPELKLVVTIHYNHERELPLMAMAMAKDEFRNSLSIEKGQKVKDSDTAFVAFVNQRLEGEMDSLSITEKVLAMYSNTDLNEALKARLKVTYADIFNELNTVELNPRQVTPEVTPQFIDDPRLKAVKFVNHFELLKGAKESNSANEGPVMTE